MRFACSLLVALIFSRCAFGQYEWRQLNPEQFALLEGGRQIGNLKIEDGSYHRKTGPFSWEKEPSEPPIPTPPGVQRRAMVNFGVDRNRISVKEKFSVNGREVKRAEVLDDMDKEAKIPRDEDATSLTIIGAKEERKRVLADLERSEFAAWRKNLIVKDYDPAGKEKPMLECGFVTTGHPTIYLQAPGGEVLARVDHYDGPRVLEKVRERDPNYQPDKDPDPTKPEPLPSLGGAVTPEIALLGALGLAAVCLGLVAAKKRKA